MPAVGGFVFDSAGALVDREIRVYRRDTGALLGKTRSSGGVEIRTMTKYRSCST